MSKKDDHRQVNVNESNGNRQGGHERAKVFRSFGKAAEGKVQQSIYETKWAAYQPWAVVERPDHQYAPVLTEAARKALEADHVADDYR